MSWKKYFKVANTSGQVSPISGNGNRGPSYGIGSSNPPDFAFRNYQSRLPEVYSGHPNRVERYNQYENMDSDSEINACLDIISEFSTQVSDSNGTPFEIDFNEDPTDHEVEIIKKQLQQWVKLNKLDQRIFKLFRNTLKYGDQVFIRDPETFELYWVDMTKVGRVIVNESKGKEPEQYVVRDINPNFKNLSVAVKTTSDFSAMQPASANTSAQYNYSTPNAQSNSGARFQMGVNESTIDAKHVVHISLTEGLDLFWPFGQSILENVFKVFKQKELLEDAILIYRVQRAPERRVFYIDVGNMPSHLAMSFVERVKNEIHQRRIPTQGGGGTSIMDATYNPLCLDLSTKIPLLDGRTLSLSELIREFEAGKENWAYSCDPESGRVVPGLINWAGVTRKNSEVIEITFDNGKTLVCTPDHKIPVFGKGFVEAKDLTQDDSLIAFNTRTKPISGEKTNKYEQVWDHSSKSWIWTHRIVGEFFRKLSKHQEFTYLEENVLSPKTVIHHKDSNRFNNDPRNLTYMDKTDHILYHSSTKKQYWENMSTGEYASITAKISKTVTRYWESLSDIDKQTALFNIRAAQKKSVWLRQNDPTVAAKYKVSMSVSRKKYLADNPAALAQVKANLEHRVKIKNQELVVTFDMLQIIANKVKTVSKNKADVIVSCNADLQLLNLVKEHNLKKLDYTNAQCKIDFTKFGYSKLDKLIATFGYKNWKCFVKEVDNFNHRIVSIKTVSNRDTGTITIDGYEKWHSYHTFAVDSGIFVKNSMNEDFFFPQTAEGRGSKVETLPAGENLGQIDDLKYFNNKLMRGLRVPSSYLPTGPDDSERPLSDGKVGTALIQEYRFNQYCIRLQSSIVQKLDDEFKMFLRWRGFNIDAGLFNLTFAEPQNFAAYRQADVDVARISSFMQLEQTPYLSKRFMLERYLGLTEDEIVRNSKLWAEENDEPELEKPAGQGLRSVGVSPGGFDADIEAGEVAMAPEGEDGALSDGQPPSGAPAGGPPVTTAVPV